MGVRWARGVAHAYMALYPRLWCAPRVSMVTQVRRTEKDGAGGSTPPGRGVWRRTEVRARGETGDRRGKRTEAVAREKERKRRGDKACHKAGGIAVDDA